MVFVHTPVLLKRLFISETNKTCNIYNTTRLFRNVPSPLEDVGVRANQISCEIATVESRSRSTWLSTRDCRKMFVFMCTKERL